MPPSWGVALLPGGLRATATATATGARRRRGLLLARGPPFCPFKPLHLPPGLSFPPWEHRKSLVQIK